MATQRTVRRLQLAWELAQESRPWPQRAGEFLAVWRMPLSVTVVALALLRQIVAGPRPRSLADYWDPAVVIVVILLAAGLVLRSWAAGVVSKNRTLTDVGPYSLCRHPLYLGSFLIAAGLCLLAADVLTALLVFGPMTVIYAACVWREERLLSHCYRDAWREYAARVPCLIPWRLPDRLVFRWSYAVWRGNEEYRAVGLALSVLLAFGGWRLLSG